MKSGLKNVGSRERGYILLLLLLFVALLSIGSLAVVERIEFQIKREREEELIHRGVQYSRAVRRFIQQNGRYPVSIEELEDGKNNVRFLRKRYKDPITGKDFHVLHMEDVPYMGSGDIKPSVKGAASQSPPQQLAENQEEVVINAEPGSEGPVIHLGTKSVPDPLPDSEGGGSDKPGKSADAGQSPDESLNVSPIIGVASMSNGPTIREFRGQNRYNQWLFIYNPSTDRAGVLTTPDQPRLNNTAQAGRQGTAQSTEQSAMARGRGSTQNHQR